MASSTFKGRYEECSSCIFQVYNEVKNKYNCKHSHSMIRKNANGVGVKHERYFEYCGLKQNKGDDVC